MTEDLNATAEKVVSHLRDRGYKLATAESCTGGMLSALITSVSGASEVLECGFVTYSNQSKIDLLGVAPKTINTFGAVGTETAAEMAFGAIDYSDATIGISITGIAGPSGGSDDKPVGTVCMAVATRDRNEFHRFHFEGDREEVRHQSCMKAMRLLLAV